MESNQMKLSYITFKLVMNTQASGGSFINLNKNKCFNVSFKTTTLNVASTLYNVQYCYFFKLE